MCAAVAGPGFAERHREEIDAFVEIARHRPLTRDACLRQLEACRAHDVSDRLGAIGAPTLVLHGDADPLVALENGRHLAAGIAGARLVVYAGVGHIPEVEIAERFNDDPRVHRARIGSASMPERWDDETDAILAGDLTAALGYRTPAGGVVVLAVAPIGLRDREAGTVGFTTSLGFSRKLERIARDPRVALAFHAREHGTADSARYVLVQGRARVVEEPSPTERALVQAHAEPRLGPARRGVFWDRWLREYYAVRVPVWVELERLTTWPDLSCAGTPTTSGSPAAADAPASQPAPRNGTAPRVDVARAARRVRATAHALLGYAGSDGFPVVVPVAVGSDGDDGLRLSSAAPLAPGARRAGLLGHSYRPQLIGLESRAYTGWLEVGDVGGALYAPHTEAGYRAPASKTGLLLVNGLLAKRGVRQARRHR